MITNTGGGSLGAGEFLMGWTQRAASHVLARCESCVPSRSTGSDDTDRVRQNDGGVIAATMIACSGDEFRTW